MVNSLPNYPLKFKRVLLKLSGESLQGEHLFGINADRLMAICQDIAHVVKLGVQVGIVIGGGNLIRGADLCATGVRRITADQMGMLATVINGLSLLDILETCGIAAKLMSAVGIPGLADIFDGRKARAALKDGHVVIFAGGTGNPLVTTDSAAALRGIEIEADIVLKATKVDGVFAADPLKNPKAERYDVISYDEVLEQRLGVMDLNAIMLCRSHKLPLRVFNMNNIGALLDIIRGKNIGTLIQNGDL